MSSSRNRPWNNNNKNERHYCPLCNSWMGSDRQSILIHENGRKHREAVERDLERRRFEKDKKEREERELDRVFRNIEQKVGGGSLGPAATKPTTAAAAIAISKKEGGEGEENGLKQTINSWDARKRKREEAGKLIRLDEAQCEEKTSKRKVLAEDEGHYFIDDRTYLEGNTYHPIIKKDMPVQLWIGGEGESDTSRIKQLKQSESMWKMGLVVKINHPKLSSSTTTTTSKKNNSVSTFDIAYLRDINDEDETLETNISPDRIRILLKTSSEDDDDSIPSTIEEARLALMGGEEIIHHPPSSAGDATTTDTTPIDENTGLSSWNVVSVRRVTAAKERNDEIKRERIQKREESERRREKEKMIQIRNMEEAKAAGGVGADDSALGAYDVFGLGGYKGVNIVGDDAVVDAGMKLSGRKDQNAVSFKKRGDVGKSKSAFSKKVQKNKKNRRRTTLSDDED